MSDARDDPADAPVERDAVVVGGGAAGLSAALFCARYGLDTLVFDRGRSAIRRSYVVENYLGLPAVTPAEFLAVGRAQVEDAGGRVVEDHVTTVVRDDGEAAFRVETADGRIVLADSVVTASAYDADYLPGGFDPTDADRVGRTDREGLYVAGWLTGGPHQVIACAGHGARVGKAVVADRRRADGWWDDVAEYWDWSVPEGRYGTDEWHEAVDSWLAETRPDDVSDERFERVRAAVKRERLGFETTPGEREDRIAAGRATMREHLRWPDDER